MHLKQKGRERTVCLKEADKSEFRAILFGQILARWNAWGSDFQPW